MDEYNETIKRVNISDIENLMTNLNESMQEGIVKVSTDNQPFLETISNWILPISSIVLIFLLWTMLMSFTTMRQGGGQGGQVSFGKSKARMINQEDKTNYRFEPWHFRYVGVENANKILKNNLIKSRSQVEEGLEDIVKQSILKYLTNRIGYNKSEINNITVTLVIDFERKEQETKLIIEEYLFEINYKNKTILKIYRLGSENDFFVSENLKELGMEIEVFENGIGITE